MRLEPSQYGSGVDSHFQIRLSDFQIESPSSMAVQLLDMVDISVQMKLDEAPGTSTSPQKEKAQTLR